MSFVSLAVLWYSCWHILNTSSWAAQDGLCLSEPNSLLNKRSTTFLSFLVFFGVSFLTFYYLGENWQHHILLLVFPSFVAKFLLRMITLLGRISKEVRLFWILHSLQRKVWFRQFSFPPHQAPTNFSRCWAKNVEFVLGIYNCSTVVSRTVRGKEGFSANSSCGRTGVL